LSEYGIYFVVASIGCLVLVLAELNSHRLGWWKSLRLALVWLAIIAGLYLLVEWFLMARNTTSALI
jgi:hypothetical protein